MPQASGRLNDDLGNIGFWGGWVWPGLVTADVLQIVDLLKTEREVDADHVITFGIGAGRVTFALLAAAMSSGYRRRHRGERARRRRRGASGHTATDLIPYEGDWFLRSDLAGVIAPRPLYLSWSTACVSDGPTSPPELDLYGMRRELAEPPTECGRSTVSFALRTACKPWCTNRPYLG